MTDSQTKDTVRLLRRRSTPAEKRFWPFVRNRRLKGMKFLRQHPICISIHDCERTFIADFYCAEINLVIEIDGPVHDRQRDYDEARTAAIEMLGLHVLRFTNCEVMNNIQGVLDRIIRNSPPGPLSSAAAQ
jgi:very-short-patch-repair endonuclease